MASSGSNHGPDLAINFPDGEGWLSSAEIFYADLYFKKILWELPC